MPFKIKKTIFTFLKGMAMGAADVVPGVSGGTIAFITGIYDELLQAINSFNFELIKTLNSKGLKTAWKSINGNFLLALFAGILLSILTLAKGIRHLLYNEPILVWSFFFGLVLASILFVGKQITTWNVKTVFILIIGSVVALYITSLPPLVSDNTSRFLLFFAGTLAICAMILPGISGAFILVLLGAYQPILKAIEQKNLQVIAIFGTGAIVGLLSFSRVLKYFLNNYRNLTLACLTGFIIGSLNKIWPWKETLTWRTNSHGIQVPLLEKSISPFSFPENNQLFFAIALASAGFILILALERVASIKNIKLINN